MVGNHCAPSCLINQYVDDNRVSILRVSEMISNAYPGQQISSDSVMVATTVANILTYLVCCFVLTVVFGNAEPATLSMAV